MPRKPIAAPANGALMPHWTTADGETVKLYLGDVREVLRRLPPKSVQCCITSPPYWGLRDYGVDGQLGSEPSPDCGTQGQAQCGRCFVCTMVAVFRGVRRVLRDDGTLWLNLGDTYANTGACGGGSPVGQRDYRETDRTRQEQMKRTRDDYAGLRSGNLVGIPWRVAMALQADGWVLRQDIIWHKPSPMPESVRNRCTKAHEYLFLLSKQPRYFYDADAISEPLDGTPHAPGNNKLDASRNDHDSMAKVWGLSGRRNRRSVWTVSSQGYAGAHFATFPPKLIEPMILAGTSAAGCCSRCGAPVERVVEKESIGRLPANGQSIAPMPGNPEYDGGAAGSVSTKTIGWQPTCRCNAGQVPCVVLDPFMGSGTTAAVAVTHGRRAIGIDLSREYIDNHAAKRINEALAAMPYGERLAGVGVYRVEAHPPEVRRVAF